MSGGRRAAGFLSVLLCASGILHLARPETFDGIVPRALPGPARAYTYASGVAEFGVTGLLAAPRTRHLGGIAAMALFVAVFPANLQMAYDARGARPQKRAIALGRLPLQGVLIAQAWHVATAGDRG
ncbi:DoxX family protein [Brachybacterium tyrofermentans]|uniref:DoxX family protein n=1 Tax=Brachybacterium tyrofermentans TaxID=47848 RepID=UPI003FD58DDC